MRETEREIVGAFIFSLDARVLLGKAGTFQGHYVVPGGGIEINETKEQAVKREILEETGLDISDYEVTLLPDRDYCKGTSSKKLRDTGENIVVHMKFTDFLVKIPKLAKDIEITLDDDFTDALFMNSDDLKRCTFSPSTKARLSELGYI